LLSVSTMMFRRGGGRHRQKERQGELTFVPRNDIAVAALERRDGPE
jgi:hypothetical protein